MESFLQNLRYFLWCLETLQHPGNLLQCLENTHRRLEDLVWNLENLPRRTCYSSWDRHRHQGKLSSTSGTLSRMSGKRYVAGNLPHHLTGGSSGGCRRPPSPALQYFDLQRVIVMVKTSLKSTLIKKECIEFGMKHPVHLVRSTGRTTSGGGVTCRSRWDLISGGHLLIVFRTILLGNSEPSNKKATCNINFNLKFLRYKENSVVVISPRERSILI